MPWSWSHSNSAPSVGLPTTDACGSSAAVLFKAMASAMTDSSGCCSDVLKYCISATRIWFWVSVPVLSVHITVAAPMVSQACIRRTRLFVFSILRML